jgi:long-chain fatty acid transport protein
MRRSLRQRIWTCATLTLLLCGASAGAQTNAEINAGIQFNFSTPGARSLGLGGAFIGLADDATAAFTNPAGLTVLTKPEVSAEVGRWNYTSEFVDSGHSFGQPSGTPIDTVAGLRLGTSENDVTGLSFASFVYPHNRWAVAVYRHELAKFETGVESQGAFVGGGRLFPVQANFDLEVVNLGLAGAFRLTDKFSLGLGVSSYDFQLDSRTNRYFVASSGTGAGGFYGPPDRSAGNVVNRQTLTGDDRDLSFNAGLRWALSEKWGLGAVYRQGPKFEFDAINESGPRSAAFSLKQTAAFNTPDVFGLGLAFRPTDAVTITLDWDRIKYSSLAENSVNIFYLPTDATADAAAYRAATKHLTVDDANEIHLGFEYILLNLHYPLALRLGGWSDPDHRIRFEGAAADSASQTLATLFQPGDDDIHYAAGFGVVFGERFQVDAAADFSDAVDTASLSGVLRF